MRFSPLPPFPPGSGKKGGWSGERALWSGLLLSEEGWSPGRPDDLSFVDGCVVDEGTTGVGDLERSEESVVRSFVDQSPIIYPMPDSDGNEKSRTVVGCDRI